MFWSQLAPCCVQQWPAVRNITFIISQLWTESVSATLNTRDYNKIYIPDEKHLNWRHVCPHLYILTPSCRDASCTVWRVIWIFKYTTCQTAAEGNPPDEIYNVMGTFWCIFICCKYKQQLSAGIMLLPCFKYNI